jgi:hypothetical protein
MAGNLVKLTLGSLLLLMTLIAPAHSLPGQTKQEITGWIKNHSFLASYYFTEPGMDATEYLTAFRQLQDGYFIDVIHPIYMTNQVGIKQPPYAEYSELQLTRRKYVKKENDNHVPDNTYFISDNRPWEIIEVIDVWSRTNDQGLMLIQEIFGKTIKNDFANSKMIFDDYEYVEMVPSEYFREKIEYPNVYPIEPRSYVKLFIGEKWGYEVHGLYPFNDNNERDENNPKTTLRIKKRNEIIADSAVLSHNKKMFDKKKNIDENRNSPANIKIKN